MGLSQYEMASKKILECIFNYIGQVFDGFKGSMYFVCPNTELFGIKKIGRKRDVAVIWDDNVRYGSVEFPYNMNTFSEYAANSYIASQEMLNAEMKSIAREALI